jgi:DNA polymerase-1
MLAILIDANSVGYAGQHAADLKTGDQQTQAIYNSIMQVRAQRAANPGAAIFYLWDSKAKFRYDAFPDYKGTRSKTPEQIKAKEEYHSQTPFIKKMMTMLGINQIEIDGFEADDVGFQLTKVLVGKGYDVKLVSSDKDWLQMIDSKAVSWYDPRMDRHCNINFFEEFTGFPTIEQFVAAKCIVGDTSDNIDGVPGLGEKGVQLIFTRWPTITDMVKEYKTVAATGGFTKELIGKEFARHVKKINAFCANENDAMRIYIRNQKLINLARAPTIAAFPSERGKVDADGFFELCGELAFQSILRKPEPWLHAFFNGG